MARVALLDVNVLVALFDPDHVHHDIAHDWFADHHEQGWATCPITENGLVRVVSNRAYGLADIRPDEVRRMLQTFCMGAHHVFWPDDVSVTDATLFRGEFVAASRHVTDIYLLGLATRRGGCLATFDRTIPIKAVANATTDELQVISPVDPA